MGPGLLDTPTLTAAGVLLLAALACLYFWSKGACLRGKQKAS
jgi:hypothetical protein